MSERVKVGRGQGVNDATRETVCVCGKSAGRYDREVGAEGTEWKRSKRVGVLGREVSRCGGQRRVRGGQDWTIHGQCVYTTMLCGNVEKKDALVELGYGFFLTYKDWKKRSVVKLKHPDIVHTIIRRWKCGLRFPRWDQRFFSLYFLFLLFVAES